MGDPTTTTMRLNLTGTPRLVVMQSMRRCGWTLREIGCAFGVSRQFVSYCLAEIAAHDQFERRRWLDLKLRVMQELANG